jgi:hypothetical protein
MAASQHLPSAGIDRHARLDPRPDPPLQRAGWRFPTRTGKAHFSVVHPIPGRGTTMAQGDIDNLVGTTRDAVLISQEDGESLSLQRGKHVFI